MPPSIKFRPNIPHTLALSDPSGELDTVTNEVTYPTTQGELLVVSYRTAVKINLLGLKVGDQFGICKRQDAAGIVSWDVWLAPATELQRAEEEAPEVASQLEDDLRRSLQSTPVKAPPRIVPPRKPVAPEQSPWEFDRRGNGTTGPLPQSSPAIAASARPKAPPQKIPYNVAFAEITQFVTAGLKATGEQWNDQAKQDMVSTVLIAAAKQGLLEVWERGQK